jgi:alpha-mannosidase
MSPPIVVPAACGPPRPGASGWFFHLDSRSVQLTRVMPAERGFAVRLLETEGRQRQVRLRCFRQPAAARQRDFTGRPLADLPIQGDAVRIDLGPYEVTDVELRFGGE